MAKIGEGDRAPEFSLSDQDGKEVKLDADMLVIADHKSPVALAGIMGGIHP